MTFDQYLAFMATPENLKREASDHGTRLDRSSQVRAWYNSLALADYQEAALRSLAAQPGGPAKIMAISEEWSSDCRRDVPVAAKIAEAAGMELRIFARDGDRFSDAARPSPADSPNADLMGAFLKEGRGHTWQSIPVIAFFTKDLDYLYHYTEFPAIYEKDRVVNGHLRAQRAGETTEEALARGNREFADLQASPMFRVWADAAVNEIISALHRRMLLGVV